MAGPDPCLVLSPGSVAWLKLLEEGLGPAGAQIQMAQTAVRSPAVGAPYGKSGRTQSIRGRGPRLVWLRSDQQRASSGTLVCRPRTGGTRAVRLLATDRWAVKSWMSAACVLEGQVRVPRLGGAGPWGRGWEGGAGPWRRGWGGGAGPWRRGRRGMTVAPVSLSVADPALRNMTLQRAVLLAGLLAEVAGKSSETAVGALSNHRRGCLEVKSEPLFHAGPLPRGSHPPPSEVSLPGPRDADPAHGQGQRGLCLSEGRKVEALPLAPALFCLLEPSFYLFQTGPVI